MRYTPSQSPSSQANRTSVRYLPFLLPRRGFLCREAQNFWCSCVRPFVRPSRHFLLIFKIRIGCKIDFGCSKSELLAKHGILARFENVQTIEATVACWGSKLIQALFLKINKFSSENDPISEYYVFWRFGRTNTKSSFGATHALRVKSSFWNYHQCCFFPAAFGGHWGTPLLPPPSPPPPKIHVRSYIPNFFAA